jgi:hypothetical protein
MLTSLLLGRVFEMSCQKACPYTVAIWQASAEINSNVQNLLEQRVKLKHTASKEYF